MDTHDDVADDAYAAADKGELKMDIIEEILRKYEKMNNKSKRALRAYVDKLAETP